MKLISARQTFLILLLLAGCGPTASTQNSGLPVVQMRVGSKTYNLEVADNDYYRDLGLMYRDSMPADHGMLFIFDEPSVQSFWMQNTRIPLDILFLDSQGTVVSVHQMKPYDRSTTSSDQPAKYAIELNVGQAVTAGAKAGDRLTIPSKPQATSKP